MATPAANIKLSMAQLENIKFKGKGFFNNGYVVQTPQVNRNNLNENNIINLENNNLLIYLIYLIYFI